MSIFASALTIDAEYHANDCTRWVETRRGEEPEGVTVAYATGGKVAWLDETRPCSCAAGPIVYRGSHILPADTDLRGGSVDLAQIPGWIYREGQPPIDETGERHWPWLRLWVASGEGTDELKPGHAAVVLDRAHVQEIHTYLGEWLEQTATEQEAPRG